MSMCSETKWQSNFKSLHYFHKNYVDLKSLISELFFFLLLLLLVLSTDQHSNGNGRKYCSYPWPVLNKVLNKVQYQMLLVLTWHCMLYKHRTHYRHGSHNVRLTCFQSRGVNYKAATLWEDLWGYLHNHNHYHFQKKCQSANFANCMQLEEADFCQIFYNECDPTPRRLDFLSFGM